MKKKERHTNDDDDVGNGFVGLFTTGLLSSHCSSQSVTQSSFVLILLQIDYFLSYAIPVQ
jgi:hypothetical protein